VANANLMNKRDEIGASGTPSGGITEFTRNASFRNFAYCLTVWRSGDKAWSVKVVAIEGRPPMRQFDGPSFETEQEAFASGELIARTAIGG
jgi:hypothetical protein